MVLKQKSSANFAFFNAIPVHLCGIHNLKDKVYINNIFPTSFKNLNRNLYVNLENSNFKLTMTTTTHLVLLQNKSSNH